MQVQLNVILFISIYFIYFNQPTKKKYNIQVINHSPMLLSEYDPINVLMYADDLIVLAKSEEELQNKMDTINAFFNGKKLCINEAKTKCMVFNRFQM